MAAIGATSPSTGLRAKDANRDVLTFYPISNPRSGFRE
jgi:hypothetical protein